MKEKEKKGGKKRPEVFVNFLHVTQWERFVCVYVCVRVCVCVRV